MKSLKHADFVFANELEAQAYSKAHNLGTESHAEIAKAIAKTEKSNTQRQRTVIITDGPKPVTVVTTISGSEEFDVQEFTVEKVADEEIVDSNGAGDAFVGAYFSQLF